MSDNKRLEGKAKGGVSGHRFFVFILNFFGLQIAYFFLRFVAFYFFVTAKSTKTSLKYFREILGYKKWKSYVATYQNYYIFGQTILISEAENFNNLSEDLVRGLNILNLFNLVMMR